MWIANISLSGLSYWRTKKQKRLTRALLKLLVKLLALYEPSHRLLVKMIVWISTVTVSRSHFADLAVLLFGAVCYFPSRKLCRSSTGVLSCLGLSLIYHAQVFCDRTGILVWFSSCVNLRSHQLCVLHCAHGAVIITYPFTQNWQKVCCRALPSVSCRQPTRSLWSLTYLLPQVQDLTSSNSLIQYPRSMQNHRKANKLLPRTSVARFSSRIFAFATRLDLIWRCCVIYHFMSSQERTSLWSAPAAQARAPCQ